MRFIAQQNHQIRLEGNFPNLLSSGRAQDIKQLWDQGWCKTNNAGMFKVRTLSCMWTPRPFCPFLPGLRWRPAMPASSINPKSPTSVSLSIHRKLWFYFGLNMWDTPPHPSPIKIRSGYLCITVFDRTHFCLFWGLMWLLKVLEQNLAPGIANPDQEEEGEIHVQYVL